MKALDSPAQTPRLYLANEVFDLRVTNGGGMSTSLNVRVVAEAPPSWGLARGESSLKKIRSTYGSANLQADTAIGDCRVERAA